MALSSTNILILFILLAIILLIAKDKVERSIQIIFLAFIFMDFAIPPGILGIKIFDGISLLTLPFFLSSKYFKLIKINFRLKIVGVLFLLAMITGSLLSLNPWMSLLKLWQQCNYFLFFVMLTSYLSIAGNVMRIRKVVIASSLSVLIFTLIQIVLGIDFTFYSSLNPNVSNQGIRFPGPFHDPQKFAQYLAMSAFLLFAFSVIFSKFKKQYIYLGIFTAITIIATGSRGALFGFAVGIAYFILIQAIHSKSLVNLFIIGIVGFFTFIFSENALIFKRVESSSSDLAYRYSIWIEAYDYFLDNPVSGIGTGNYQAYSEKQNPDHFWMVNDEKVYFDHPESGFLLWLVEYGIIGFGILAFTILYLINPFKHINKKVQNSKLITFLEAGIVSWIIGFITVYSLGDKRIGLILLILCSYLFIYKYNWQTKSIRFS